MFDEIVNFFKLEWQATVEIFIFAVIIYVSLRFIQQARGHSIVRGLFFSGILSFVGLYFLAKWLHLDNLSWIVDRVIPLLAVTLLIIFQPEVRHALVRIGYDSRFSRAFAKKKSQFVNTLVQSAYKLGGRKIGALIAIEREDSLDRYSEGGSHLDAEISPDLIMSIFWPNSPLHDGGMIVANQRIKSAAALFPLSERPDLPGFAGTRHRAGIGLTEETDAVVIIVSEETGKVSISVRGNLNYDVKVETLEKILTELFNDESKPEPHLDVSEES